MQPRLYILHALLLLRCVYMILRTVRRICLGRPLSSPGRFVSCSPYRSLQRQSMDRHYLIGSGVFSSSVTQCILGVPIGNRRYLAGHVRRPEKGVILQR